jgi:hypothetical protein
MLSAVCCNIALIDYYTMSGWCLVRDVGQAAETCHETQAVSQALLKALKAPAALNKFLFYFPTKHQWQQQLLSFCRDSLYL